MMLKDVFTLFPKLEKHRDIYERTKKFVEKIIPREEEIDSTGRIPKDILNELREGGYFGLTIPREYGGQGAGLTAYVLVQELFGRVHDAINMILSGNNGIGAEGLLSFGTEEQKRKYLPDLASGYKIAAFALTEPEAGSDAAAIRTTAKKVEGGWILNGTKIFITRGEMADLFTVVTVSDREKGTKGGFTVFLVERGFDGFNVSKSLKSMGSDVVGQTELVFEDCFVPDDNVVGEVGMGFPLTMRILVMGRLYVSARSMGAAERLLETMVKYAGEREQFGRKIGHFQGVSFQIADRFMEIYAAKCMIFATALLAERMHGEDPRKISKELAKEISACKAFSTEVAFRTADTCVQVLGAKGWSDELPVERMLRDLRGMRIFEGTNEIHRLIIGRELISG